MELNLKKKKKRNIINIYIYIGKCIHRGVEDLGLGLYKIKRGSERDLIVP
jgi:hypothetical protein